MPFYDYKCTNENCNHEMENQLKKFEEKVIKCEKCNNDSERQISGRFAAHGLPNGHIGARIRKI